MCSSGSGPRPRAQVPEQRHRRIPGHRRQGGHHVEVECHARAAVERHGNAAGDDKVNAVIVELIQDLEEAACH
jgi:hypothetical protein